MHWKQYGEGPSQFGDIVPGVFTPVLAKHTKSFNLIDSLGVGVERIQRNFEPSGGRLAKDSNQRRARKADFVCRFVDGSWKRPERSCLRLDARPISGMNLRPKSWPCQHSTYIVGAMCYVTD